MNTASSLRLVALVAALGVLIAGAYALTRTTPSDPVPVPSSVSSSASSSSTASSAASSAAPAPQGGSSAGTYLYENPELGFSLELPSSYSVFQTDGTIFVTASATTTQSPAVITVAPIPKDASGRPYQSAAEYARAARTIDGQLEAGVLLGGQPAVKVTETKVLSLPNPDAYGQRIEGAASVQSINIVGYMRFVSVIAFRNGLMYSIRYFAGDGAFTALPQNFSFIAASAGGVEAEPIVTNEWEAYVDDDSYFSIRYPQRGVRAIEPTEGEPQSAVGSAPAAASLAFEKDFFFSTKFADTIVANIYDRCSELPTQGLSERGVVIIGDRAFLKSVYNDAAAGTRYQQVAYDTLVGDSCYRIDLFIRGTNGAGFYEVDPAAVQRLQDVHDAELARAIHTFEAILSTFSLSD